MRLIKVEPKEVWSYGKDIVTLIVLPFCYYILKEIKAGNQKTSEIEKKVDQVNTTLIGVDGQNGLRSRFKALEDKVIQQGQELVRLATTIINSKTHHE